MAGFGLNEMDIPSRVLKVVDLPAIDYYTCQAKVNSEFLAFIGSDKFCAGNAFNETVCRGDSGGGYVEPKVESGITHYYLRGLVSLGSKSTGCAVTTYTTYTNVLFYDYHFFKYTEH